MSNTSPGVGPLYQGVSTIYSHHGQLWAATPPHFLDSLYRDFDYRDDDVWLISYPRSGTTWTYTLLYAVLYDGDIEALQEAQAAGIILKFLPIEVGSADSVTERIALWKSLPSPRVIPTHLPYRLFPQMVLDRSCPLVHILRDPRDVAVSFYHFHRSHRLLGLYRGSWEEFFECFITGRLIYGSWFDHTSDWLPHTQGQSGGRHVLRYEELRQDLAGQIREIASFLHRELTPQAVSAITDHCSFQAMRANPFTNRGKDPIIDSAIASFLRKGVVGDWRNYFTESQLERIDAECRRNILSPPKR